MPNNANRRLPAHVLQADLDCITALKAIAGYAPNAPNLSRLICQMLMRLDASWPGKTSLGLDVAAGV